ncbi:hypothetical protein MET9862_02430 [Methylobacterium symbioticum]|uniref:Uncharacterized protein n=1 Tax=Methylobacterium symbioticum TaxID=2584084 RepID=A0A509ECD4_9HYPH|nr:hypothetical protein MET9862_02430 [Methylobacterium symbioticum]
MARVLAAVALILVVAVGVAWDWSECRGAGHGVLYCLHIRYR